MSSEETPEGVVLPELDDPLVVKDLLRAHSIALSKRLAEAQHKNVRREEVIQADMKAAAFLAATLCGKNPAYSQALQNTPEKIINRLRAAFPDLLVKYGISEEEAKDPTVFMQIMMYTFTNQVHELINELQSHPDQIERDGPKKLEALLEQWTSKITKDKADA